MIEYRRTMTSTLSINELGNDLLSFKEFIYYNAEIRNISHDAIDKQFSKGLDRLKSWLLLYNHSIYWHPYTKKTQEYAADFANLNRNQKTFCLTVLMILFQVFGDGNHRTAYYFYEKKLGFALSAELKMKIIQFHSLHEFSMINLNLDFIKQILELLHIKKQ